MIKRILSSLAIPLVFLFCNAGVLAQTVTAQWTQKANAAWLPAGPGPRAWSNLFWDSTAQRLALFGGSAGGGYKADIWHYNVTADTWTSILLPTSDCPGYYGFSAPDGRDAHASGFDPINNGYWSVAGSGYKCGAAGEVLQSRTAGAGTTTTSIIDPNLTETTVDYFKHWTVVVDNYYTALVTAYDPVTKKLTLASAVTGLTSGKGYKIRVSTDGQTWHYAKSTGVWQGFEGPYWGSVRPSPVVNPPFRHTPGFAWSTQDNVFVFHGGGISGNGGTDTWVLNPATKTWTLKQANSYTGPMMQLMELTNHFVYDQANDVFILFGGRCGDARCGSGTPTSETWAYKLSTNTWTKMSPTVKPPAREVGAMYYDASIGKTVLFGGATVDIYNSIPTMANLLNDVWVYDYPTNTWTQIPTTGGPTARHLHMMGYDPIAQIGVMYSGKNPSGVLTEMWTLKLTQPVTNTPPVAVPAVSPASGTTATNFAFSGAASSDPGGSIVSYVWNFGDGTANGSGVSASHTYASPGNYTASLTVTDNAGATATANVAISVVAANTPPVANATVSPSTGTTATNFAFSGAASSDGQGPISSYVWDFGDGTSGSGVTPSHVYAAPGNYTATLTVTDSGGLTNTATVGVVVSAPAPTLTFYRSISGTVVDGAVTQVLVAGQSVPFTVSGNAYSATISSPVPGAVAVTIQYSGPGGSGSQVLSVVVP